MASNIGNILNTKMRLSGMASGLDTDSLVQQLMKVEQAKVDKVRQDRTLLEWKRDDYRTIINSLRSFKDEFFDVLKPATNFRSSSAFASYDVRSDNDSIATAKANAGAASTVHTLKVSNLATAASIKSSSTVTSAVNGSAAVSDFNLQGKQIEITLDGVKKTIGLENYTGIADMQSKLQIAIDGAFGKTASNTSKLNVLVDVDKLEFKASLNGSTFSVAEVTSGAMTSLGFAATDNLSNKISVSGTLDNIERHFNTPANFDGAANIQFTINGTSINVGKTFAQATINDVMNAVNTSNAGVELKYDALNDNFSLTSKTTGSAETISISDTSGLFTSLGIDQANLQVGEDAIFDLDGVVGMQRSTNNFTINGVAYTLNSDAAPGTEVKITVNANADGLVDKIKSFVAKYNEVLGKINGELSEKRARKYQPLTNEEKEAMKEEDIKNWEEKARSGLLANDNMLNNIVNSMRKALMDGVDGGSTTLAKIGITTGTYETKGKLVIDETKLRAAISQNTDEVVQLFTKESQYTYNDGLSDSTKRQTRYQESGLAQRLNDILQDNIKTARDINGKKGLLIEKAGITSDSSEIRNYMYEMISQKDAIIDKLLDKLVDKENAYYKKFAALEKAMTQMNSQSGWLAQQFGGGQ